MYRRYKERRYHRRRNSSYNDPTRRLRSALRRPSTQIAILLVVALIIYLILQSANQKKSQPNSLPPEVRVNETYTQSQNSMFFLDTHTQQGHDIPINMGFIEITSLQVRSIGNPAAIQTTNFTILEEA